MFMLQDVQDSNGSQLSMTTSDGIEYNTTHDFEELKIRNKKNPVSRAKIIARCAHFPSKLIISFHKDIRIPRTSTKFQSNYERAKKAIYLALQEIDYVNELGLDMPIFEIVYGDTDLIKRIRIDSLAKDIHDEILSVLIQTIAKTLFEIDDIFRKEISSKRTDKTNLVFRAQDLVLTRTPSI